jgi:hypothetical protein
VSQFELLAGGFFSRSALASARPCCHPNYNSPSTIRPVKPTKP